MFKFAFEAEFSYPFFLVKVLHGGLPPPALMNFSSFLQVDRLIEELDEPILHSLLQTSTSGSLKLCL